MDMWKIFCETGNIDAYLLYSESEYGSPENRDDSDIYDDE